MDPADCGLGYIVPTFCDANDIDKIREQFYKDGVVFLTGCDEEKLLFLGNSIGTIVQPRNEQGKGTGISNIRFAPGLEGKGYSSEELFFHTDRSGWDAPPRVLITALKVKAETGGHSILVDGQRVLEDIRLHNPFLYDLITSPKFSSIKCDDGTFKPRPIFDEATGILRLRFDDGIQLSATLIENFGKLRSIIYKNAFAVDLQPGCSYIIDNHRFLHGRTSFTGSRELLRILAYPHPAVTRKFVLFDVDGTICRAEALSIDAFFRCLSDVSGKDIRHDNTHINLHGQTDLSLVREILRYHGFDDEQVISLTKTFLRIHPYYLQDSAAKGFKSTCCPQVQQALTWISEQRDGFDRPVCVGLLTGNSAPNALQKIKDAGVSTKYFDLDISAFGQSCPSRVLLYQDCVRKIEAKYGVPVSPDDIMLVGDTPLDVNCAKSVGCKVLAVATGNYKKEELTACNPDFTCDYLTDAKGFIEDFLKA